MACVKEFYHYSQEMKPMLLQYHPIDIPIKYEGLRQRNTETLAALTGAKVEKNEEGEEPQYGDKVVSCRSIEEVMKWITVKNTKQHEHDAVVAMQKDLEEKGMQSQWFAGAVALMQRDLGDVLEDSEDILKL